METLSISALTSEKSGIRELLVVDSQLKTHKLKINLVVCRGTSYLPESEMRKSNIDANQRKESWFRSRRTFTFVFFDGLTIREDLGNSLHERVEAT